MSGSGQSPGRTPGPGVSQPQEFPSPFPSPSTQLCVWRAEQLHQGTRWLLEPVAPKRVRKPQPTLAQVSPG